MSPPYVKAIWVLLMVGSRNRSGGSPAADARAASSSAEKQAAREIRTSDRRKGNLLTTRGRQAAVRAAGRRPMPPAESKPRENVQRSVDSVVDGTIVGAPVVDDDREGDASVPARLHVPGERVDVFDVPALRPDAAE